VVGPGQKEEVLAYVEKQYPKSSHARACRLLSQTRSKKYHQSKMKEKEKPIVEAIKEATAHRRYGRFLPCPTFAMPISLSQDLQSETFLVPLSVALHSGESESIFYDNGYRIQTRNSGKGKVPWGYPQQTGFGVSGRATSHGKPTHFYDQYPQSLSGAILYQSIWKSGSW
jgi:hypothetical protein